MKTKIKKSYKKSKRIFLEINEKDMQKIIGGAAVSEDEPKAAIIVT